MLNLSILVEQSAKRNPKKPALSLGETTLSYSIFHDKICQTANALTKKGIGYGDKVALLCPNILQFPIIFFGILKVGATVVPLSIFLNLKKLLTIFLILKAKCFYVLRGLRKCRRENLEKKDLIKQNHAKILSALEI